MNSPIRKFGITSRLTWIAGIGIIACCASLPSYGEELLDMSTQETEGPKRLHLDRPPRGGARAKARFTTDEWLVRLNDRGVDERVEAATALAYDRKEPVRVIAALIPLLADANEHIRYSAEWSIAYLVKAFQDDAAFLADPKLSVLLEKTIQSFHRNGAHEQNRLIVELAVRAIHGRVKDESSSLTAPSSGGDMENLARNLYEVNDLLGRLQFVYRLSDLDRYPDFVRRAVLEAEAADPEPKLLAFALHHWGEDGQRILASMIACEETRTKFTESDARLIQHLVPTTSSMVDCLIRWARDVSLEETVREACIESLIRFDGESPAIIQCLARLLSDTEPAIQAAAAQGLTEWGALARETEFELIRVFRESREDFVRFAALDALMAVAGESQAAASFVVEQLWATSVDDQLHLRLIEACGEMGSKASAAVPQLIALLTHPSSDVRAASAEALGKFGAASASAIDTLVARVFDKNEEIRVKNRAAAALKEHGESAIDRMLAALPPDDEEALESGLHVLAIAGVVAAKGLPLCLSALDDRRLDARLRVTAAEAIGAIGISTPVEVQTLLAHAQADEVEWVRAASLIAAAQLCFGRAVPSDDPGHRSSVEASRDRSMDSATRALAMQGLTDSSRLVRASAAYAVHLAGDTRAAFDGLLGLLDGSEADDLIERTLARLGPQVDDWVHEVACDPQGEGIARLTCCTLACRAANPDWDRLLPLVEDYELGEAFADRLTWHWHVEVIGNSADEPSAVAALIRLLQSKSMTPTAHARLASLLVPDGLGAGEDEESWMGFELTQPRGFDLLSGDGARREVFLDEPMAAAPSAPAPVPEAAISIAPPPPPAVSFEPPAAPLPSSPIVPTDPPRDLSIRPKMETKARGADSAKSTPRLPKEVEVLYGTNRVRDRRFGSIREVVLGVAGGTVGCVAILLCSTLGFAFSGNRRLAFLSLIAMGFIGPFGFYAAQILAQHQWMGSIAYTGDYQDLVEYGKCTVSLPPDHRPGELEAPRLWKLELEADPDKHVMLKEVTQLSQSDFFATLDGMQMAKGKNLLVFIHGYNVSFDDAARRTAQMSSDLKFPGAPIFFSWPSQANWYGYRTDHENVQLSVKHIRRFLLDLAERSGAETINLVAHSMGNVGLTEALKEMETVNQQPMFNQVVLAAPDIDADIFKDRIAPFIVSKAERVTLYTSKSDLALIASRFFNSGPRAGDSGPEIVLFPGIDTIDATAVDSSLLGHSYYGQSVSVLSDVERLLKNQPITMRRYLRQFDEGESPYWAFDPALVSRVPESGDGRTLK